MAGAYDPSWTNPVHLETTGENNQTRANEVPQDQVGNRTRRSLGTH